MSDLDADVSTKGTGDKHDKDTIITTTTCMKAEITQDLTNSISKSKRHRLRLNLDKTSHISVATNSRGRPTEYTCDMVAGDTVESMSVTIESNNTEMEHRLTSPTPEPSPRHSPRMRAWSLNRRRSNQNPDTTGDETDASQEYASSESDDDFHDASDFDIIPDDYTRRADGLDRIQFDPDSYCHDTFDTNTNDVNSLDYSDGTTDDNSNFTNSTLTAKSNPQPTNRRKRGAVAFAFKVGKTILVNYGISLDI